MRLTVSHEFLPKEMSINASIVMDHFGIDFEQGRLLIAEDFVLPIQPGDVVCFTGPSGSGKSSLLRAAAAELRTAALALHRPSPSPLAGEGRGGGDTLDVAPSRSRNVNVLDIDSLDLGNRLLIDRLPLPFGDSQKLLSDCGLSEPRLLLRTSQELSDGQRYRFRLALALAQRPQWIVADEFTATLDRTLAKIIAFNLRRLATRTGTGFLLATTHADILDDLQPSLHVECGLNGRIVVNRNGPQKKRRSASPTKSMSPRAIARTGRISLGGITAAPGSAS